MKDRSGQNERGNCGHGQAARRSFALFVFYFVTGLQIAAASPGLSEALQDQPGGVRQCSRKIAGGKEDRIARSWHRNVRSEARLRGRRS